DYGARTASRTDDHVRRFRRAMDEVPRAQLSLLAFDDQNCLARNDEEGLLVGLPVVHGHRFARPEHERIDAELFESPLAFEIVADDADGAAAVDVTPLGVAHVEDEPSLALRDEPVLGLLQLRLGTHEIEPCRKPLCAAQSLTTVSDTRIKRSLRVKSNRSRDRNASAPIAANADFCRRRPNTLGVRQLRR